MDIGSFLASVIDFERFQYGAIEKAFFNGYKSEIRRFSILVNYFTQYAIARFCFRSIYNDSKYACGFYKMHKEKERLYEQK